MDNKIVIIICCLLLSCGDGSKNVVTIDYNSMSVGTKDEAFHVYKVTIYDSLARVIYQKRLNKPPLKERHVCLIDSYEGYDDTGNFTTVEKFDTKMYIEVVLQSDAAKMERFEGPFLFGNTGIDTIEKVKDPLP